jgi:hypothetical protein
VPGAGLPTLARNRNGYRVSDLSLQWQFTICNKFSAIPRVRLGYYGAITGQPTKVIMNNLKTALISVAALCSVAGVGVFIGAPLYPYYYPRYYYPPAYYPGPYAYYPPAALVAPAAPPVYIEQPPAAEAAPSAPPQAAGSYWYYCRDSQAYYPYVQQCASPWQQVVPQSGPPGPQSAPAMPQGELYDPQAGAPSVPPASADPESIPRT